MHEQRTALKMTDENVIYRLLHGLAKPETRFGSFVREGDYSHKWIAAAKYPTALLDPVRFQRSQE